MQETQTIIIGFSLIAIGVVLIQLRSFLAPMVANFYRKLGMEIPQETSIRQFVFVGVMLMLPGLIVVTGLLNYI